MASIASPSTSSRLFQPLKVGNLSLSSRIVMAPLTRFRADDSHVPLPIAAEYYAQRASVPGTLLITEATYISPKSSGYPNTPGIWSPAQIAGWKSVVDAVHAKGSYIFLQIWALGRTAKPDFKLSEGTGDVVSSSAVPMPSEGSPVPRALSEDEIEEYISDFATAAKNAVEGAGFDGVEIHGANGYLVDQFIQDVVNQRTDKWGGSVENRARFPLEIVAKVSGAIGKEKTAIRLSPWGTFQGMRMEEPVPQFGYLIEKLRDFKLAYLHLVEARVDGQTDLDERKDLSDPLIDIWGNAEGSPVFLAGGFNTKIAKATVDEEYKHVDAAVVFGRHFISNPDLVFRIQHDLEFNPYDRDTFYLPKSTKGYTDYPFSQEFLKENPAVASL